jgi:hypothetical protein
VRRRWAEAWEALGGESVRLKSFPDLGSKTEHHLAHLLEQQGERPDYHPSFAPNFNPLRRV